MWGGLERLQLGLISQITRVRFPPPQLAIKYMEELERKKISKDGKTMTALSAPHIRALVDNANDLQIPREDIVTIISEPDQVVLIYYR